MLRRADDDRAVPRHRHLAEIGRVLHEENATLQQADMGMPGVSPLVVVADGALAAVDADVVGDDAPNADALGLHDLDQAIDSLVDPVQFNPAREVLSAPRPGCRTA